MSKWKLYFTVLEIQHEIYWCHISHFNHTILEERLTLCFMMFFHYDLNLICILLNSNKIYCCFQFFTLHSKTKVKLPSSLFGGFKTALTEVNTENRVPSSVNPVKYSKSSLCDEGGSPAGD